MKIILYCNRNVGMVALSHLVSLGHEASVISEDEAIFWLANRLGCGKLQLDEEWDNFDLFFCVHGRRIIPAEKLVTGKFVNIHPCLQEGHKGHNPVKRFLESGGKFASISSLYMTEKVDEGAIIETVTFDTKNAKSYAEFYNEAFKHYYFLIDATLNKIVK